MVFVHLLTHFLVKPSLHCMPRGVADKMIFVCAMIALSCDKNVLLLISGQTTVRQCIVGIAEDTKVRERDET